jgi:hypothetical protein
MLSYAVDGLSFYYIPHSVPIKPGAEAKLATISVIEGEMNSMQVKAKMETLREKYTAGRAHIKNRDAQIAYHRHLVSHYRVI